MNELSGIKVIDFTQSNVDSYCVETFKEHGAEIIKIELNKQILIKSNASKENLFSSNITNYLQLGIKSKGNIHTLLKSADLLITNYPIGVPEKVGIDFQTISQINPKICMVHITGCGLVATNKGTDRVMNGNAHMKGISSGTLLDNDIAERQGVIGALLALRVRDKTGKGQFVDVGKLEDMVSLLNEDLSIPVKV